MANVTIPNLTSATTITPSTDLMVLEQTQGTRKATLSQIFTSSATSGSGLGITSGGVYAIKSGLDSDISDINTLLGSTSIASIGDGTVTGAVSQINSDLSNLSEYESGTVQRQSGTIGANSLRRCGNTVNIVFSVSGNTTPIATSVGIVPSAFRPAHDKFGVLTFASGASFVTTLCKIATDGAITCPFASPTTAPNSFFLAFEYNLG